MTTKQVKVTDLIGKDIRGIKAIVTQPQYRYQYPQGVPVAVLVKAYRHKQRIHHNTPPVDWLRIEFDKAEWNGWCGFSGMVEESHPDWSIEIVDEE